MSTGWTFNRRTLLFVGDREALDALWEADYTPPKPPRRKRPTKVTEEMRARMIELREKGRSLVEIAEVVGVSREAVRRALVAAGISDIRPALQPCGTPAAYKRHRAAGEIACDACRRANTEANIVYRGRRAGQVAA